MPDQGGARGRAETWRPYSAANWRPTLAWPGSFAGFLRRLGHCLRAWALAEIGAGRLVPWLAIAFGTGIVLYFTADREPAIWAAGLVAVVAIAVALSARRRPIGFPLALATAVVAAGFATATLKRAIIAHPVVQSPVWNVEIAGFVETREERERSDRIVVLVNRIEGQRLADRPERVRLSVRKGTAPPVGSFVQFKARLAPPLEPLSPGGYDFARDMYFHGIGASGFVLGRIQVTKPPAEGGFWLRYATAIDDMREAIDKRIRSVLPGDKGSIASALITGKRDAISTEVNDAMFISGLGHILSISGLRVIICGQEWKRGETALVFPVNSAYGT